MAMERVKRYDSGGTTLIDTTNGNTFFHGFGRMPALVEVRLVVKLTANGYAVGEELPLELLVRDTSGDLAGSPRWTVRVTDQRVLVFIAGTDIEIIDSSAAPAAVTLTNYRLRVTCLDVFPIG